jgi:PhnB protein
MTPIETSIAPWLAVLDGARAVEYYTRAFGAVEVYRLDGDDGQIAVARLKVDGADFWVQDDRDASPQPADRRSIRMILTLDDPDALYAQAVAAGATPVTPMGEAYGWRTGRITDPFGHDWEFSKPVEE